MLFTNNLANLCEQLGRQLLIFDENSTRALIALFLDCHPDISTLEDPSYESEWSSLLNGIAAVLYQTAFYLQTSLKDTKRLELLFHQLQTRRLSAELRCILTQSCVNMILPTRNGDDPDKKITRNCLHVLMSVLQSDSTADHCLKSAQTILAAIKGNNYRIYDLSLFYQEFLE